LVFSKDVETSGVKYIGSKKKLIPSIISILDSLNVEEKSIIDVFTGTTRCAQAFRKLGYRVQASDLNWASEAYANTFLKNWSFVELQKAVNILNNLPGKKGWLTEHYSSGACQVFQEKNTKKADEVRDYIDEHFKSIQYPLITSLLYALDSVDSTVGVQQAYLKDWSFRSFNDLLLKVPGLIEDQPEGKFYLGDCLEVEYEKAEIAYLDPPYSPHNYQTYYHIFDSVFKNDKPDVLLKTNRRSDRVGNKTTKSLWNSKASALTATKMLIKKLPVKWVIMSYSNDSLIPEKELMSFFYENYEGVQVREIDYKRNIMSQIGNVNLGEKEVKSRNKEFLIYFEK